MTWSLIPAGIALKSIAVLAVAFLIARSLSRQSAAARHLVWTAAFAALLLLPVLSVSLPTWNVPAPATLLAVSATAGSSGAAVPPTAPAARTAGTPAALPSPSWPGWRTAAFAVWAVGSAFLLLRLLLSWRLVWRARRTARPAARCRGMAAPAEILESPAAAIPMTFGILRPAILLPETSAGWDDDRLRVVLLHELAHIHRADFATQVLARIAVSLYWWNPLVWTAWREFVKERERAADDLVLAAGACPTGYAGHLLAIAREFRAAPASLSAAVAMARPSELEGRLVAILDSKVRRGAPGRAAVLAAALAALAILAPLASVWAQAPEPVAAVDVEATIRVARMQRNFDTLDRAAETALRARDFAAAQQLLEAALAIRSDAAGGPRSPAYAAGLVRLGDLEKWQSRDAAAAARYQEALAITREGPEAARALVALGAASFADKNLSAAADSFELAARAAPARAGVAKMWLALVREQQENMPEADALFQTARSLAGPQSRDAAVIGAVYARFLLRQNRPDEARVAADAAAAAAKSSAVPPPSTNALRVGGDVKAPRLVHKVEPVYSLEGRAARHEGTCRLMIEVGADGRAHHIRVISPLGLYLDERAMDAVSHWRFEPGTRNGQPVNVLATIEVNFRLL